jgi:hypothetical protein
LVENPSSVRTIAETGTANVAIILHSADIEFARLVEGVARTEVVELLRQSMGVNLDIVNEEGQLRKV